MVDYLAGFNPTEVRQPTTDREKRVAEAAALAGVDAYNFFENGTLVHYNYRKPTEDGGVWVTRCSISCSIVDFVSLVTLCNMVSVDPSTITAIANEDGAL